MSDIYSEEWRKAMNSAFKEGFAAKSILDNPYWKTYPKDAPSIEESRARHWVDGYYDKLRGNHATNV